MLLCIFANYFVIRDIAFKVKGNVMTTIDNDVDFSDLMSICGPKNM